MNREQESNVPLRMGNENRRRAETQQRQGTCRLELRLHRDELVRGHGQGPAVETELKRHNSVHQRCLFHGTEGTLAALSFMNF